MILSNNQITHPSSNNEIQLIIQASNNIKTQSSNSEIIQSDNSIQLSNSSVIIDLDEQTTISTNEQIFAPPYIGQVFESWESTDNYLNDYAWQKNFVIIKTRNDRDPPPNQHKLIATYSKAAKYLNSELYSSKERWAKAYTTKFFTAGISSTSHVESENSVIKNVLQAHPSLCELAAILDHNELPSNEPEKEEYDTQQIHLNFLLADLTSNEINKKKYIEFDDRWYKNEKMQELCLDEQPYIMNDGTAQLKNGHLPCPSLFPMHQITKIRGDNVFSPETFNLAQKAVQSAVETGGESLCRLKKYLNNWFAEEKRLIVDNDNNKENFDLSQVEDPIERQHRGSLRLSGSGGVGMKKQIV
ncbi:38574_t:CDS:2 [Gigaspora margarita]|uniref:38574_t:CDS:1 n=1 Tax=Gigaspora margarita TaxID=4874 RepID=A0ABN7USH6_GIGMA|nr:38574_t:CDS:2 [Gigaspora margarita]